MTSRRLADQQPACADPLPEATDVLIVGGGLAGAALAYFLAGEGVDVVARRAR